MTKFSKMLAFVVAAATSGATAESAFAGCYESYQPSYDYAYNSYDNSSDYGYDGSYGWDHHGFGRGHGRFGGHDRRR